MSPITVAIIIINYNGKKDTLECLSSIGVHLHNSERLRFEIALLDNHSTEPISEDDLPNMGCRIHYFRSEYNSGFAGGNNMAIELIKQRVKSIDYYFLLNNDTVLVDNSLVRLVESTVSSDYAITGLVNYYYSNPEECWQAGTLVRPHRLSGKSVMPTGTDCLFSEVDSVPGSSLLIRSRVADEIGLLDERYFAYYEELDWCLRAKENGYKVAFLNGTRLLHKVGKSSPSQTKHYLRTRNTLLLYSLHYDRWLFIAKLRILLRTLKCIVKEKNTKYWQSYMVGIKDYNKSHFGKGSLL